MFEVAKNEFSLVARNRIIVVFVVLVLAWAVVNTLGYSRTWDKLQQNSLNIDDPFYLLGFGSFFYNLSMLCAFLSMCIGIISIADERSRGSLRVLMTKPLYRRDIITGKFLGISLFTLLLVFLCYILFVLPLIIFYGGPVSFSDFLLRLVSIIILTFLNSSFTLGLVMLIGIVLGKAEALVVSLAYIALEWVIELPSLSTYLGKPLEIIDPVILFNNAINPNSAYYIFSPDLPPFSAWLGYSMPYIVLMVAEVVAIVLVNCTLFNQEET